MAKEMKDIVDELFVRERKEKELGEYVKSLCKKYGVKYRFLSERKYDKSVVEEIKSKSVVIFLPDLADDLQMLGEIPEGRKKEILEEIIKHANTHIRLFDELERRRISVGEQTRIEFVLCSEFYVAKIAPLKEFDQMKYNKLRIEASTKEGRSKIVKKIQKNVLYTSSIVILFSEDEIKELFEPDQPVACEFLLILKNLYTITNSVDDIIKNVKLIRFLVGFAK